MVSRLGSSFVIIVLLLVTTAISGQERTDRSELIFGAVTRVLARYSLSDAVSAVQDENGLGAYDPAILTRAVISHDLGFTHAEQSFLLQSILESRPCRAHNNYPEAVAQVVGAFGRYRDYDLMNTAIRAAWSAAHTDPEADSSPESRRVLGQAVLATADAIQKELDASGDGLIAALYEPTAILVASVAPEVPSLPLAAILSEIGRLARDDDVVDACEAAAIAVLMKLSSGN